MTHIHDTIDQLMADPSFSAKSCSEEFSDTIYMRNICGGEEGLGETRRSVYKKTRGEKSDWLCRHRALFIMFIGDLIKARRHRRRERERGWWFCVHGSAGKLWCLGEFARYSVTTRLGATEATPRGYARGSFSHEGSFPCRMEETFPRDVSNPSAVIRRFSLALRSTVELSEFFLPPLVTPPCSARGRWSSCSKNCDVSSPLDVRW